MRIHLQFSLLLAISLLLAGCSTVPNRYIPNAVGSLNDADDSNNLRIDRVRKPGVVHRRTDRLPSRH